MDKPALLEWLRLKAGQQHDAAYALGPHHGKNCEEASNALTAAADLIEANEFKLSTAAIEAAALERWRIRAELAESRLSSAEKERDAATDSAFRSAARAKEAESRLEACTKVRDGFRALLPDVQTVRTLAVVSDLTDALLDRAVESQEIKCCKCGKPTDPISAAAHKDGAGWICRDCFYVPV